MRRVSEWRKKSSYSVLVQSPMPRYSLTSGGAISGKLQVLLQLSNTPASRLENLNILGALG